MSLDSLPLDIIRQIVNSSSDPEKLFEAIPDQTLEICEPQTRLVKAATLGSIKHVKTALRDGADPNVFATHCKNLALHTAICHKHINIVVHLLEIGADPALEDQMDSANILHRTNVYQTALYHAVQTGNEELVSLILDTKVDVELGQRTIEHCSEDDRRKLEKKNKPTSWIYTEETPLQHACFRLHPNMAIIKMLVEHGADVNAGSYIPPFCLAICYRNRELITYLLEVGADVNKPGWGPICPKSALTRILDDHDNDLKVQLLEAGADPNFNEALITQALNGKDENVELLLRYGADPNLKGRWDEKTALESVKHKLDHETRWSESGARKPGPFRKSMKKIARMLGDDFVYSTSDDEKDGPILYTEHCRRERKRFMEIEEREEKRKKKRQKREERESA